MHPIRVQRKRARGWKMPENTVYVGRPTVWGNPFTDKYAIDAGFYGNKDFLPYCFRDWIGGGDWFWGGEECNERRNRLIAALPTLRGKNLACWCRLDQPCHADVLLELANR